MLEKVVEILNGYVELEGVEIKEDSALIADLGLNSLDVVEIVVAFEDEFEVEIPERVIREFVTVGDIVKYLEKVVD